ncbi:hypothetical protein MJT46_010407 [Ovis ammon polii x Ovis aries]|nr:hypothetical protein MJT46_010407 [Ovis ammon polii x Ovis aries]
MQMRNEPEKYQKLFKGAGDRNPRSVGEGMAGREHRSGAYDNVIVPDVITSLNENRKSFAFKKRLPDVRWFDYIIIESKGSLGDTATEVQREKIQLDCGGPTILSEIETIYLFRMYYFSSDWIFQGVVMLTGIPDSESLVSTTLLPMERALSYDEFISIARIWS